MERNLINAAQWYVKAAKQGNTEAEINLAWLYHLGQGVPKNENIRARLYEDAAQRGEPLGYTNLGEMYRDGDGVKKDYARAIEFLRKGSDLGNSSAQNDLGEMYRDGKGMTRDPEASVSWFLKAAEQNNDRRAFENLFQHYRLSSPPDLVTAYQWAYVSAQNGSHEAEKFLKDGSKKLSKADVETAVSRASEWLNAHRRDREGCTTHP